MTLPVPILALVVNTLAHIAILMAIFFIARAVREKAIFPGLSRAKKEARFSVAILGLLIFVTIWFTTVATAMM